MIIITTWHTLLYHSIRRINQFIKDNNPLHVSQQNKIINYEYRFLDCGQVLHPSFKPLSSQVKNLHFTKVNTSYVFICSLVLHINPYSKDY